MNVNVVKYIGKFCVAGLGVGGILAALEWATAFNAGHPDDILQQVREALFVLYWPSLFCGQLWRQLDISHNEITVLFWVPAIAWYTQWAMLGVLIGWISWKRKVSVRSGTPVGALGSSPAK